MKRGRPKLNFDQIAGRFPEGTIDRIDAVRKAGETRTAFLQQAVEEEIARRGALTSSGKALDTPDE